MRCALTAAALMVASVPGANAAPKVFYLEHAGAVGMPQLLDELVASRSPWAEELQPHWAEVKGEVKARADVNAIEAEGSAKALAALEGVLASLDVPRRTITVSYVHVRVPDPTMLVGKPAGPPTAAGIAGGDGEQPIPVRVAPGDWMERVRTLADAGRATILQDGTTSVLDGSWGAVYVGDPERDPEFLLQGRPVLMDDGEVWLTLAFGHIERRGAEEAEWQKPAAADGPGLCMSCGPGVGDLLFVPEVTVSSVWPDRQSLLVEGPMWWRGGEDRPAGRGQDFVVLTAEVGG